MLHVFRKIVFVSQDQKYLIYCSILSQDKNRNQVLLKDVFDGRLYKKHFGEDGFFRGSSTQDKKTQIHLSLQINTDGVAVFRSSKFSIWPVYFIVNELPPNCRYAHWNPYTYTCMLTAYSACETHAEDLLGRSYINIHWNR